MHVQYDAPLNNARLDGNIPQAADIPPRVREIALKGKLYTADDGIMAGENFTVLKNLRYTDVGLEGVSGMTKINTTALDTYQKVRAATHFRRTNPDESHVLAQAWNDGKTSSVVFSNTTEIPSQGNFTGGAIWSDTAGALAGRFSPAPGGHVAYANNKEACIWAGNEYRVGAFLNHDPSGTFSYDWTEQVRNMLSDSENVAIMSSAAAGIDSNVKLMLHLDNNVTDSSPTTAHTVTNNGAVFLNSAGNFKFGYAASFDGVNDTITIPDDADFDLSGGVFTLDFWMKPNFAGLTSGLGVLYYQNIDATNWMGLILSNTGALTLTVEDADSQVLGTDGLVTPAGSVADGVWSHIAVVENGNDWYIFVNGKLKAYLSDASRAENYSSVVTLGSDGTYFYAGLIDEVRLSASARWTSQFDVPSAEYATSTSSVTFYVGATRPLQGVKLYMATINTAASTISMDHWAGAWTSLSVTDGTTSGGVALAQTGLISFPSTVVTARPKMVKGMLLFWYRITVSAVDAAASIYHVALDAPFQKIKDVWDGVNSLLQAGHIYKTNFEEYTLNIQENEYDAGDATTFMELDTLTATTQFITLGFFNPQCGVSLSIPGGHANTTAATGVSVYYWNGTAWAACLNIDDGTSANNISMSQSGTITWEPPAAGTEFKRDIGREFPLYYYKIAWNQTMSADVQIYFARGIPAPKRLYDYRFPFMGADRLWLIKGNEALCSAVSTPDVFNGEDSFTVPFGDGRDLSGACEIYCQFGANIYNLLTFTKYTETWTLYQDGNGVWQKFRVSAAVGCAAHATMKTANIVPENAAQNGTIVIWQGTHGIYMFDGRTLVPIHPDIKNYFDRRRAECISTTLIGESTGWFNEDETEYHWSFASGSAATELNKEFVFNIKLKKWYEIERGTGKRIQIGITAEDASGNRITLGFIDTGYMERLEYGTTFDGTGIACNFELGDIAMYDNHIYAETSVKGVGLVCVANAVSDEQVSVKHYGDTKTEYSESKLTPVYDDGRVLTDVKAGATFDRGLGPCIFHRIGFSITTTDETFSFQPKYAYVYYEFVKGRGL